MSAPNTAHQAVSMELSTQIHNFLKGKPCKVFSAPYDVILPFPGRRHQKNIFDMTTVVQPDISVICDRTKIIESGCFGAPDFVVEILSPGNTPEEMARKLDLYKRAGVREYWVVDPAQRTVQVYLLHDNEYLPALYHESDKIPVSILPGLTISLPDVFAE
jgi:Uma2 family endonuclease